MSRRPVTGLDPHPTDAQLLALREARLARRPDLAHVRAPDARHPTIPPKGKSDTSCEPSAPDPAACEGSRPARRDDEHQAQCALFAWAAEQAAGYPELELLYAIPNFSGDLSKAMRGRLVREGKKAGVPDVCLPVPRGGFGALYIEMKSEIGVPSQKQRWWIHRLRRAGNRVEIAHSDDAAKAILLSYLALSPPLP